MTTSATSAPHAPPASANTATAVTPGLRSGIRAASRMSPGIVCQSPANNSDTAIRLEVPARVARHVVDATFEDFRGVAKSALKLPRYLGRRGLGAL